MNPANTFIPFVEKYRPSDFDDIVLDEETRLILRQIIDVGPFPNLLFYGPPGTGKTTTIINIIQAYQRRTMNEPNKKLVIHLNASDERGIDIIRTHISPFVNSKPLFSEGIKFVVLDEVDYMTKNAQQALKHIIQTANSSVRFCLICNYISKIDEGLQNEFIRVRFNRVPQEDVMRFLRHISNEENLGLSDSFIHSVTRLYKSDIRLMINCLQSVTVEEQKNIITDAFWETCLQDLAGRIAIEKVVDRFIGYTVKYNIDQVSFVVALVNYFIKHHTTQLTHEFLDFVQNIVHSTNANAHRNYFRYFVSRWRKQTTRVISTDMCTKK
jgi:DNA polymerase III delta prime subunit